MSYAKLRGKIREVFETQKAFANAMGMSKVTLSQRLNGISEWRTSEIVRACELLGIHLEQNSQYFFTKEFKKS